MMNRRDVLRGGGLAATLAALGIRPDQVLAQDGGVLKVRFNVDIQVLDPGYMIGDNEATVQYACMPRLAVPLPPEPGGVWGWTPTEFVESLVEEDPVTVSFVLKPGFMWSNGLGEVTAEDVKFSFERVLTSDWSMKFPTLDRVDVTGRYSGRIILKSPFAATFQLGIASEQGTIVPKAGVEALADGRFTTEFPAQCGPYVMAQWNPRQSIVLRANPDWPGTPPAFPEVHLVVVGEAAAAELAFEAGELHMTDLLPATAARYLAQMPPGVRLANLEGGNLFTWIGMNSENPKLADVRVRKAIQRAIDVDSIIAAAYDGIGVKAQGLLPPGMPGHRTQAGYAYDPDAARALLAEAGVSGLQLDFKCTPSNTYLTMAQIVQANLADVGITLTITPVDDGPFWNLGLESQGEEWRTLELWTIRYRTSPEPSDAMQWFVSGQVGIWNWERWKDDEFDRLFEEGIAELDPERRHQIYARMQEIMEDTGCYVWVYHDPEPYAYRDFIDAVFVSSGSPRIEGFGRA